MGRKDFVSESILKDFLKS